MAAFKKALEFKKVYGIELDVHLSKDGVPVVIHDFTLKRTTGIDGFVKDYYYEELKQLDAGSWFDEKFAGEKIPTLEEVIRLICAMRDDFMLNIEVKTIADMYKGIDAKIYDLIEEYGIHDKAYITSFEHHFIKRAKKSYPRLKTGLIVVGNLLLLKEQLKCADADMLSIHYAYITYDTLLTAQKMGIKLMAWTIDEESMIKRTADFSKEIMICSNCPDKVLKCFRK